MIAEGTKQVIEGFQFVLLRRNDLMQPQTRSKGFRSKKIKLHEPGAGRRGITSYSGKLRYFLCIGGREKHTLFQ